MSSYFSNAAQSSHEEASLKPLSPSQSDSVASAAVSGPGSAPPSLLALALSCPEAGSSRESSDRAAAAGAGDEAAAEPSTGTSGAASSAAVPQMQGAMQSPPGESLAAGVQAAGDLVSTGAATGDGRPRKEQPRKTKPQPGAPPGSDSAAERGQCSARAVAPQGVVEAVGVGVGSGVRLTTSELVVEGVSVAGQETCIMLPGMKLAFDIGRCPRRAVFQDTLLISHSHIDHIGGMPFYIATRGLFSLKAPLVVVPPAAEAGARQLAEVFRQLDGSEMNHTLLPLPVGKEYRLRNGLVVKPFKTYHVIPSQGYLVYSLRQRLLPQYQGLPGARIGELRRAGMQVTEEVRVPEVAFTGDTTPDFILDPDNADVLRARLLICELSFLTDAVSVEHARKFGHTHLQELKQHAHLLQNEAILFIHFSARYSKQEIEERVGAIGAPLKGRVFAFTEGF